MCGTRPVWKIAACPFPKIIRRKPCQKMGGHGNTGRSERGYQQCTTTTDTTLPMRRVQKHYQTLKNEWYHQPPFHKSESINLNTSDLKLTNDQELLNIRLNCHFITKPRQNRKRHKLEALEKSGKVTISNDLQSHITAKASKERGPFQICLVERRHTQAAKELQSNKDIAIRRTERQQPLLMEKEEYL